VAEETRWLGWVAVAVPWGKRRQKAGGGGGDGDDVLLCSMRGLVARVRGVV
jgi:hypothetical protein